MGDKSTKEINLRSLYDFLREKAHAGEGVTLTATEVEALVHNSGRYVECDSCDRLVRSPAQLKRELGTGWWWGEPTIIAEHGPMCAWAKKMLKGEE